MAASVEVLPLKTSPISAVIVRLISREQFAKMVRYFLDSNRTANKRNLFIDLFGPKFRNDRSESL